MCNYFQVPTDTARVFFTRSMFDEKVHIFVWLFHKNGTCYQNCRLLFPLCSKTVFKFCLRKWYTETTPFNDIADERSPPFSSPTLSDCPECLQNHLLIKCRKSMTQCTTRSWGRFSKHLTPHKWTLQLIYPTKHKVERPTLHHHQPLASSRPAVLSTKCIKYLNHSQITRNIIFTNFTNYNSPVAHFADWYSSGCCQEEMLVPHILQDLLLISAQLQERWSQRKQDQRIWKCRTY